jgi:hypothetical protein
LTYFGVDPGRWASRNAAIHTAVSSPLPPFPKSECYHDRIARGPMSPLVLYKGSVSARKNRIANRNAPLDASYTFSKGIIHHFPRRCAHRTHQCTLKILFPMGQFWVSPGQIFSEIHLATVQRLTVTRSNALNTEIIEAGICRGAEGPSVPSLTILSAPPVYELLNQHWISGPSI